MKIGFCLKCGIGQVLFVGFGVMLGVLAVQGYSAVSAFWKVQASNDHVIQEVQSLAKNVRAINYSAQSSAHDAKVLAEDVENNLVVKMREGEQQLRLLQRSVDTIVDRTGQVSEKLDHVLENAELDDDTAMIIEELLFDSDDSNDKVKKECVPILRSAVSGLNEAVNEADRTAEQIRAMNVAITGFAGLSEEADEYAQETQLVATQSQEDTRLAKSRIYLVLGIGLAVGLVIPFVIHRRVARPIRDLTDRVRDIAEGEGDLTKRIKLDRKDELGELAKWMNTFIESIQVLIRTVMETSHDVASGATQIAASSEQMSAGMGQQHQQITEIGEAIESMASSSAEVARKSAEAASNAQSSGDVAADGGKVVDQTISGMNAISEAVTAGAASVSELGKRGEQIGKVIDVINDIADQTNLLALNAAIEAARAGSHGRGFAVVADEVRKLADRTTSATEEVAESIKAIQSETNQAVQRMNAGTEQVSIGVEKAKEAGQSLGMIVTNAQNVAEMIRSIAVEAEQQSASSTQVSQTVNRISATASEVNEATSEASMAATMLSQRSEQLQQMMKRFKV